MPSLNPKAQEFFPTHQHHKLHPNLTPLHFYYLFFSRELHPLFYPTTTLPLPPPSTTHHLLPPAEAHAVQQNGKEEAPKSKVFKAFIRCDTTRSEGLRLKGYARREKGEGNGQSRKSECLRNRSYDKQCFRAFPRKKCCYPLLPVKVDGGDTTVMIRNIPSKYTRNMLVDFLDNHCLQVNLRDKEASKEKGEEPSALAFDFVYLPIDFKSGLNKGYAFVNF
ncbi:uncharacterized protein LOC109818393, partial [Cajanus cajan]|uniref:uncharacterized protein LOC109818393 n=1 Tax=Cajanus cajan TaxID=3821 RepID=UPI0010FB2991